MTEGQWSRHGPHDAHRLLARRDHCVGVDADRTPAGHVIALSGRFAQPPRVAPKAARVHLIHGDADRVMPVQMAHDAPAQLQALGGQATLDRFSGLGHSIDGRVLGAIVGLVQAAHSVPS